MPPRASDLVVRVATDDELARAGELTVAAYDAEGYLVLPDGSYDHEYAGWIGDARARTVGSTVLVAVDGDRVLGTVTWCPYGSPFAQLAQRPHQGEFRTLAVDPDARRRGVARALVEDCLRRAREGGLTEVMLCSLPEMLPAHRLYASMGFRRRPELDLSLEPGVQLWAFTTSP